MQKVSKEYKESMKDILRERAYILISFGVVNQEAQAKASIGDGNFTYFSNSSMLFDNGKDDTVYATLEENFTKVDGSMFFLPRNTDYARFNNSGLVGNSLVSDKQYELTINLNIIPTDFKGVTINFGENYPVDFDFVSDKGQKIEYRNNDKAVFSSEDVLNDVSSISIIVYRMKNPHSRFRVYSFKFGYGLVYSNDDVMDSTLESYVSPIGADVPQIDFSVTLKNYDQYFNVDNPKSAINFLETGQEMDIYYGYELPSGNVEWIRGNHLLCSEWESDDYSATIRCQDVFRNMDTDFNGGLYAANGKSFYDLAVEVAKAAGLEGYYFDPRLKRIYTKNPIPRVTCKEALQIIANACRCTLSQTRTGLVSIKSNFLPGTTVSSTDEAEYSNVASILNDSGKQEYSSFAQDYTTADGRMFFIPKDASKSTINTGFISKQISDDSGKFTSNPIITLVQDAQCMYYGLTMVFGNALPSGMIIHTYNNGELVADYEVKEEITKKFVLIHNFDDFDTMKVEFTGTKIPHNRIILNSFKFGDITNFTMERTDMLSSPKAIKQELIKEVIVPCYYYQKTDKEESLVGQDVTVTSGESITFYIGEPSYDFRAVLSQTDDNSTVVQDGVSVIDWKNYYVTCNFTKSGTFKLDVFGKRYKIVEQLITKTLHERGKTVKWQNPLISDTATATDLANWLGDYYSAGVEYEYDTRGNPELDVNDIIYQQNDFHDNLKVNVYRETLTFDQAFGGKVTARRQGG